MGKEAIIEKIIADAETVANGAVAEAEKKADEVTSRIAAECYEYTYESKHRQDVLAEDIKKRSLTVAELDARKVVLAKKAEILDQVFATALEKAKSLDKAKYKKLIFGMLECAEDGDVVTVSEREKGVVTEAALADFAKKKGIKLTLNKKAGDFDGGIVLTGKGVDKNMTLDVEIALLRDECEAKIAKELFENV